MFRGYLTTAGLSPASINRHLATLRSVTRLGRMLGAMSWYLEVPGVKAEKRRDTRGPSIEDVRRMLVATHGDTEAETRDRAIVLTFVCLGLRVSELCGLNLEDTDLAGATTWIKGKGRRERELVPLPASVVAAIRRYVAHRGTGTGPLFLTRGTRGKDRAGRLDSRSVLRIVRELGQKVGLHVWCHGLRHTAITTAIHEGQRAGLGIDQMLTYSRHGALATMLIYRDEHNRLAVHRTLAEIVAAAVAAPTEAVKEIGYPAGDGADHADVGRRRFPTAERSERVHVLDDCLVAARLRDTLRHFSCLCCGRSYVG
jgi:integrase/recombinase XerC